MNKNIIIIMLGIQVVVLGATSYMQLTSINKYLQEDIGREKQVLRATQLALTYKHMLRVLVKEGNCLPTQEVRHKYDSLLTVSNSQLESL